MIKSNTYFEVQCYMHYTNNHSVTVFIRFRSYDLDMRYTITMT